MGRDRRLLLHRQGTRPLPSAAPCRLVLRRSRSPPGSCMATAWKLMDEFFAKYNFFGQRAQHRHADGRLVPQNQ